MTQAAVTEAVGSAISQLRWQVEPSEVDGFNHWYDEEHLADLLAQPGVLSGRRFVRAQTAFSAPSNFNYITIYHLDDTSALETPSYRAMATAPSELTKQVAMSLPMRRDVATQIYPTNRVATQPVGNAIMHVFTHADGSIIDDFHRWYEEEHIPALVACDGVFGARRFACTTPEADGYEFIAIYQLADVSVVESGALAEAGKPTPWRDRLGDKMRAHFQVYQSLHGPIAG
ncbi:MAG: hypothetical protein ABIQ73_19165 [Acidimicrobiales bacterium]